ncbi:MAG: histidine kinase [Sphingomonadales bacterium]|nr:histidine kinase [Sphingomonadales bacterium]PIX66734.1 MAG: histidine kinase [Sphingomonadales bacterium CG_4_10_14_3_um_filter_58_15]NCO47940.1 histidine kinase [Sphingomonadales bacterium]NCP01063.1 histidine kinase [Sphingomonadales bacterium]NCP26432.1 histidine kinase [Sphingomonadales bacterium]
MSSVPDLTAVILGLILAAWLAAAAWAIWTGLTMKAKAESTLRQSGRLGRLLETSPALPLLVRSDGKLEASQRLMHWLGFDHLPAHISELHEESRGMVRQDLEGLMEDVNLAQKTGSSFVRAIQVSGSDKALLIRGGLADQKIAPNGSALLWVFDATDSEGQIARLREENEAARAAFDALSALIEAAPVPMWHRAPDMKLTLVNSAYVVAVDAESGEQVVADGIELVETINGFSPLDAAARAKEKGGPFERVVATTVGGERRMTQVVDVPLGKSGVAGYAIDIQELEDARREQQRFGESQRDMLDQISAGVAQFGPDKSLKFCNLPFQRIFSMLQQWIGEQPEFPRVLDRMREMNRIPEVRDFPEWREERTGWFQSTRAIEENWLLADGTHLRVLANPTPDGGLLVIFEDRTEQVQLASARDTLLRVRTATFDNLFESLAVFAADGKLNIWNHQFANNWGLEEEYLGTHPRVDSLMQKMADQLRQPARISEVREMVRSATTERQQKGGRLNFTDGRRFEFAAIPLPDGNALFTMLDISDSYRIEQALRERNEALVEADSIKGRFLSNMSYEFRTPLTSIGGFAELLAQGIAGPLTDRGQEYVRAILQSVKRLGSQIENVLDLSQSEAGALPIAKDKVNLNKLIEDIAGHFTDDAKAKSIEVELQLDEKLGSAMADKKRLSQAITQIVDNAIKYTGDGGRVLIHGSGNVKQALIHISDDGPGMTAGEQSKVFDSFARSRDQKAKDKSGGLGLPLARQLVRAHGGDLTLTSEPGQGTLVSLYLPRQ